MLYDKPANHKKAEKGDVIKAHGRCYKIGKILSQEYFPGNSYSPEWWNIEFLDSGGEYHHWKNQSDGGEIIPKPEKDK